MQRLHDDNQTNSSLSRRTFVQAMAGASVATLATPYIVTAKKTDSPLIVGTGEHQYEVNHHWAPLPSEFTWQTSHNVAVDRSENLYVIHQGLKDQPTHPSIFVFDSNGKYLRSFGQQFQGGGHGLEIREEGGEEFLYVAAYQEVKLIAKLTLTGETVWQQGPPMESGVYAADEKGPDRKVVRASDRFQPTNFAFLPNGEFYLADGYGSFYIHRYDKDGKWLSCFGGPSTPAKEDGKFNTPHGISIDNRGESPTILVVDRANARLQWFDLQEKHLRTQDGFLLPANADVYQDLLLIPDLQARVTLLDGKNQVVAQLGEDPAWRAKVLDGFKVRQQPDQWLDGKFVHPHDACFDAHGNIFLAEWVGTGRITKMRKVS
ncbi:MAG: hypothetical protein O2931_06450 [Planctomycetota bacterium]|nr:hypothetical protein [Planctomycetota bacterium]MDA1178419.1 hypothetical protein [Planctomycetota bacterium]